MANILKKLVAGISTVAILATMSVPVALAADGDELASWDYTAAGAAADWTAQNDNITQTIDDGALYITTSRNGANRWARKSFSTAITTSSIIEYDIQLTCAGDGSTYLYLGASDSNHLVTLDFPKNGTSVSVNGGTAATMTSPGSSKTPWMHIKHTFDFVRNQIDTEITYKDGGNQIYSGTTGYATANATESISEMRLVLRQSTNNFRIESLTATEHEIVLTDAEKLEVIKGNLNIDTTQRCLSTSTDDNKTIYTVMKDINLPTNDEATSITWELAQRPIDDAAASWTDTSFATIEENKLVLNATDESENYYVKATATISVNEESDTKDFWFIVKPFINNKFPGSIEIWDYEFDDADWTLSNESATAALSQAITDSGDALQITNNSSNNTYTAYKNFANPAAESATVSYDMRFYCRGEGTTTLYLGAGTADCLFKMVLPREGKSATINGTDTATITGASDYYTPWLHVENTFNFVTNTVKTVIKNTAETELYSGTSAYDANLTESISRFTIDLGKYNNVAIKDVVLYPYEVTDQEIVDYSKGILEITDLTKTNDVYTATGDFTLPDAPTGTTVTWQPMQKAKNSNDWTESSFITVSGTNATINPTSAIDNYDVKLVATITSGNVSGTKDFVIDLPNPTAEISEFISTLLPVVNTTDKNGDNTITFDLSGTDVLKYDLALPVSSKTYKNITVAWTSSDSEHISIASDGTATIMTSDLNTHDVTLSAVVTYKKGDITYSSDTPQTYNIKMGYTSDDVESSDATLGKYKVRFDMAYDDNFDIPKSTTSSTSKIELPTKGHFGSTFTWDSSVPTVISNQGKVTRASDTKKVTLTASIVSGNAKDTKKFEVSVPGTGSSSGGGGSSGGSIASTATSTASATPESSEAVVERLLEEKAQAQDLFKDLSSASWAREAINGLAAAGVVNGVSDTEFAPNATVTRAQFAKMLMGAFGLTTSTFTTSSFGDVATDAWYFDAVETAYNLGIINGVENGVFAPNALITRQDMAVMVTRAAEAAEKTISEVSESRTFDDAYRISDYATAAVDTLVKAGIINGMTDTEFAPLDNATRAQAAKILYNFL